MNLHSYRDRTIFRCMRGNVEERVHQLQRELDQVLWFQTSLEAGGDYSTDDLKIRIKVLEKEIAKIKRDYPVISIWRIGDFPRSLERRVYAKLY